MTLQALLDEPRGRSKHIVGSEIVHYVSWRNLIKTYCGGQFFFLCSMCVVIHWFYRFRVAQVKQQSEFHLSW